MGSVFAPVHAGSITYITPSGSTTSGPVDAKAVFTTTSGSGSNPGTLTITLTDLQANPKDVAQLLSDLSFKVSGATTLNGATLSSSSGQVLTVNNNSSGGYTLGSTVATGWVPTLSGNSGLLDVLSGPGHAGPAHLIIGPPNGSNAYSNANGSIKNGAHNPFLNQSATFTITGLGITAATTVTSATFSFGTTEGQYSITGQAVPEPTSLVMGAVGLGFVGAIGFYRSRRRAQAVGG